MGSIIPAFAAGPAGRSPPAASARQAPLPSPLFPIPYSLSPIPYPLSPLARKPAADVRWAGVAPRQRRRKANRMARLLECVPNFLRRPRPWRHRRHRPGLVERLRSEIARRRSRRRHEPDRLHAGRSAGGCRGSRLPGREQGSRRHRHDGPQGRAPAHGALDVCPFIPVSDITMAECAELARSVGRRIGDELQIRCISTSTRRPPRSGAVSRTFARASTKASPTGWPSRMAPDAGPGRFNARRRDCVGAREFLLAYNVNLNTRDRRLANEIALNIREGGRAKRDAKGEIVATPTARRSRCRAG